MDGNNFLSIAPKSEYIVYNQKLGSAVSSKVIAKCFGKSHDKVLRDIDNVIQNLENLASSQNRLVPGYNFQALGQDYNFDCITSTGH